jgi:hypothetical protein
VPVLAPAAAPLRAATEDQNGSMFGWHSPTSLNIYCRITGDDLDGLNIPQRCGDSVSSMLKSAFKSEFRGSINRVTSATDIAVKLRARSSPE